MIDPKDIDLKILNDTLIDYRDQVQRLRECAERLQYETDAIPAIKAERNEWKTRCEFSFAQRDKLTTERDAYAKCADDMAAAHKVERDALKSENGSLRELMNTYNIGGWTDSLSLIEERGSLKKAARFALDALEYHTAQTRPIERTQIAIEILKAVL